MNNLNFTFEQSRDIRPLYRGQDTGVGMFTCGPEKCFLSIKGLPDVSPQNGKVTIEATSEHFDQIADFLNKFNFGTENKKKKTVFVKKASKNYRKKNARRRKTKNK